jgi:hypothetical protein
MSLILTDPLKRNTVLSGRRKTGLEKRTVKKVDRGTGEENEQS